MDRFLHMDLNEIAKTAAAGDVEAVEYIVNSMGSVVKAKTRRFHINGTESEDLFQEGMIGLIKAIRTFDETKNASFRTFAELCVTRAIISAVKSACAKKHIPLNSYVSIYKEIDDDEGSEHYLLEELNTDEDNDPMEDIIRQEEIDDASKRLTENLSNFEVTVLSKFLLGMNYKEIAEELGKTPKSVDNALQRIKQKASQAIENERKIV